MRIRIASALVTSAALVSLTACTTSDIQQPPPTTSPTASASPTAHATGIAIPTNWIHFSWPAAGFDVRLPSKPTKLTETRFVRGIAVTLLIAVVRPSPGPIEVGVARLGVPLTPAGVGAELQASVKRFAQSSGATLVSAHPTKFRGMRARRAILARGTQDFELLVFQRDPSHEIFVLALEGDVYGAVTSSLKLR